MNRIRRIRRSLATPGVMHRPAPLTHQAGSTKGEHDDQPIPGRACSRPRLHRFRGDHAAHLTINIQPRRRPS
jgi:hypothetical protein